MKFFIFIVFVMAGLSMEVIWTAIVWFFKKKKMKLVGSTSLWMIPFYAIIPYVFCFIRRYFFNYDIFFRGFVYMFIIFSLEYTYGLICRNILKVSPWDYSKDTQDHTGYHCKFNIKGLITLEFIPLWYIMGIIGELLYSYLLLIV